MPENLLKFYFSFKGRATRYDFNIRYALYAFFGAIVAYGMDCARLGGLQFSTDNLLIYNLFGLLAFISGLAVTCRRLHDMNISGWWQLAIYLIPSAIIIVIFATIGAAFLVDPLSAGLGGFIALLAILVFYLLFFIFLSAKRGTVGPNQYGPDPLQTETVETVQ